MFEDEAEDEDVLKKTLFRVWIKQNMVSVCVRIRLLMFQCPFSCKKRALEFLFPQPSRLRYESRVKIQRKAGNETRIDQDRQNRDWTMIRLDAK